MNKTTKSLTAKLRDVARAFCLEVQGEALNATGVDASQNLKGPSSVYYPLAFRIAPIPTPLVPSSTPASLTLQPLVTPSSKPSVEKEKQGPIQVVELEVEEAEEGVQPQGKGKEKEKDAE